MAVKLTLNSFCRNALQYHGSFLFGDNRENHDMYLKAKAAYVECQKLLSDKMTSKLASYDYPLMTIGALLLTIVSLHCMVLGKTIFANLRWLVLGLVFLYAFCKLYL